jgi:hypothetical protein
VIDLGLAGEQGLDRLSVSHVYHDRPQQVRLGLQGRRCSAESILGAAGDGDGCSGDRASQAVSNPMPELPPMTTTRLPSSRITTPFRVLCFSVRSFPNRDATVPAPRRISASRHASRFFPNLVKAGQRENDGVVMFRPPALGSNKGLPVCHYGFENIVNLARECHFGHRERKSLRLFDGCLRRHAEHVGVGHDVD